MKTSEIIAGLEDLVEDRKSFIMPNEPDSIFAHDKAVLQAAIDELNRRAKPENEGGKAMDAESKRIFDALYALQEYDDENPKLWICAEAADHIRKLSEELEKLKSAPENKPLTLEQLKCMNRRPVWVTGKRSLGTGVNGWMLISTKSSRPAALDFTGACNFADYGKTWLAYAHELKGSEST